MGTGVGSIRRGVVRSICDRRGANEKPSRGLPGCGTPLTNSSARQYVFKDESGCRRANRPSGNRGHSTADAQSNSSFRESDRVISSSRPLGVAALFVAYFAINPLQQLLGVN